MPTAAPYRYEAQAWRTGLSRIAGIDEAGRGPLAGPVVAAAVVIAPDRRIKGLCDSKVLPAEKREALFAIIQERAVAVGVGIVDHLTIDRIEVVRHSRVRRSKLYYLRGLAGKAARLKERRVAVPASTAPSEE